MRETNPTLLAYLQKWGVQGNEGEGGEEGSERRERRACVQRKEIDGRER